jgi:uncharacterized membrane protein
VTKAIASLSLLGLALSAYLTWVHYAELQPFCTGISDCERVQSSEYARLAGIPVALIGLLGYSAILASLRGRAELTAATAYIGLAFSAYLTWVELFRIAAICQWCIASALTIAAIAGLATARALSSPGAIVAGRDPGGVPECRRWASRSTSSQRSKQERRSRSRTRTC